MDSTTKTSFWQRPEGTTGKLLIGAIVAGIGYAAYVFLPFLITLAQNTLYLGFLVGVIAALYYIVFVAERPRTLLFFALQGISRWLTSFVVAVDPVGILQSFIKDMQNKRKDVVVAIKGMEQLRSKVRQQINLKTKERDDAAQMALAAKKRLEQGGLDASQISGLQIKLQEYAERVGRRDKAINTLQTYAQQAEQGITALTRIDNVIQYHISNSTDEMEELKTDNELALMSLAATRAANDALGDSDKLDVKSMAVDVIRDRTAKATSEVEHLIESTRSIQGDMDLEKLAVSTAGMQRIMELNQRISQAESEATLPRQAKARVLSSGTVTDSAPVAPTQNQWAELLKKKQ